MALEAVNDGVEDLLPNGHLLWVIVPGALWRWRGRQTQTQKETETEPYRDEWLTYCKYAGKVLSMYCIVSIGVLQKYCHGAR